MKLRYELYAIFCLAFALLFGSQAYSSEKYIMEKNKFGKDFDVTPSLWIELEDGLKIQFLTHSHKMQMAGGPESPLIVTMNYELSGKKSEEHHYLYPDENGSLGWRWNNYNIQVMKYVYGERMTLNISKEYQ